MTTALAGALFLREELAPCSAKREVEMEVFSYRGTPRHVGRRR